ncbi:CAP domain-containing protein [Calothrix sp. UHCC 0171]|uniref:CAP domain-containing protein n=1 Tax=Calothrix sp. UHCC 0171 TaxID=3110245 RepID=UPI002B1EE903|nr:CAP domain-containing protein [Calothrix sp. UHCC 0171]MEA5570004.1 CAP domain-containing protein [Calothrix sp. UHCC 0171]
MPVNLFDANFYRSANSDLRGLDDAEALVSFQTVGLNSNLQFSPFVDLSFYRASNSDLSGFSNQQLFEHLANYGIAEGRKFSRVFDLNFYRANNSDLSPFSNEQLFEHFTNYGLREGRNASEYITADFVGNNFRTAREIAVTPQPVTYRDAIDNNDQIDVYKFNLDSQDTSLHITLNGLSGNLDLQLLNARGHLITSVANSGNANESFSLNNLTNGTYYLRVYQASEAENSNYNLTFSSKLISNSVDTVTPEVAPPAPTTSTTTNNFIQQVLDLTNTERIKGGLQPLRLNHQLNQSAQNHSEDMALQDYFSHTGVNGSSAGDRATSAGYKFSSLGENIAAGYITPEEVVQGWMSSPGHRANIMNANYQEMGLGYYYLANDAGNVNYNYYWTQDFGTSR